jgi:hypothetical protein
VQCIHHSDSFNKRKENILNEIMIIMVQNVNKIIIMIIIIVIKNMLHKIF